MKKLLSLALLLSTLSLFAATPQFAASASNAAKGVRVRKVSEWIGGLKVDIGIHGDNFEYVGNPNVLNRCDRVVFNLDLRKFIYAGHVSEAFLEYQNSPMGALDDNEIELEVFASGRSSLRPEDLIASDSFPVCRYNFTPSTPKFLKLDITRLVNQALSVGDGYITFRIRNATIETRGNTKGSAEGIIVSKDSVRLFIKK